MIGIDDRLIVHRRVDRGNHAIVDTEAIVQTLNDGYDAVSSTGGIGYDAIGGVEAFVVHTINNRRIHVTLRWLRKQQTPSPAGQMLGRSSTVGESTRALHD